MGRKGMPIPLPLNTTTTTPPMHNVTATTPVPHHTVTTPALGETAKHLLKGVGKGILPEFLTIALFVILAGAIGLPLLMVFFRKSLQRILPQPSYKMPWLFFDPVESKLKYTVLWRIAPNIYASEDGQYVALARHQSQPITLDIPLEKKTLKENGDKALYGVKIGDVVLNTDKADEVVFTLFGERVGKVTETAKLLLILKEKGIINDIVISPNMSIIVSADKNEMAKYFATTMGDLAADTMVDVAAMTGSRQEFQAWVKQLVELEKERLETVTKSVNKMALAAFAFLVIIGLLYFAITTLFH